MPWPWPAGRKTDLWHTRASFLDLKSLREPILGSDHGKH